MVCTFEVVLAMTLTGHSWAKSCCLPIHLKEGGVAPKPSTCTVASLYVGLFRISCLRLQPHQKIQLRFLFNCNFPLYQVKHYRKKEGKKGTAIQGPVQSTHCISSFWPCGTARCQTGVNRAALISTNMQKDLLHMTCHMKKQVSTYESCSCLHRDKGAKMASGHAACCTSVT